MTNRRHHLFIFRAERIALFLLVGFMCLHTLPRAWRSLITDFPNYYMAATLVHEGFDASRMYEWSWLEREKDLRAVDVRVIGLLPITPASTLVMLPLAGLTPLCAKHIWILLNLAALIPIGWLLRSMTGLSYQRVAIMLALSFPLHRNLSFGQFYVFLLLLMLAGCWAYLRRWRVLSGVLVATAAACKIFPIIILVFFIQRKDWKALTSAVVTGIIAIAVSVWAFGWNVHGTYLREVLPWTLRGEAMPPYIVSASISSILHRMFLSEPQWNPHPWHYSPLYFSVLLPVMQTLVIAPAILLIRRRCSTDRQVMLEWSALTTASLAISTVPALYNFVLMVFPVCVVAAMLLESKRYRWLAALVIAHIGIGCPTPNLDQMNGVVTLLPLLRLPLMLVLLLGICVLMWRNATDGYESIDWSRYVWSACMLVATVFTAVSTFHREDAMRKEYVYRLPLRDQGFANVASMATGKGVRYISFTSGGYRMLGQNWDGSTTESPSNLTDILSFADSPVGVPSQVVLVEQTNKSHSRIVDMEKPSMVIVDNGRNPMLSLDGQDLAFIRDDHGRGQMRVLKAFTGHNSVELSLSPSSLNVYEASFVSGSEYAFSAAERGGPPGIYLKDATHANVLLEIGEARYPALSPDHRWLAYSRFDSGGWNLWLRNQNSGATKRISNLPCNELQPAWESDSKTLLYSTDCGRSLWFTAVARRKVIP